MNVLGNRLKEKRTSRNLSQKDIAEILSIKRETYTCWELGKHKPNVDDLIKLADLFETSTDYLLGRFN